jgi:hypothetical protein
VSRRKKKCSKCKDIASRFRDVGFVRVWFCTPHFKEIENGTKNVGS